jgi:hypothetical protein
MRRDAALIERFTKLDAQEAAGRVTRYTGIEPVHEASYRLRILIEQFGQNREVVVIDDRVNAMPERREFVLTTARISDRLRTEKRSKLTKNRFCCGS